jgi:hypothetical protein
MDTKYFHLALQEYIAAAVAEMGVEATTLSIADIPLQELSNLLKRAQELKDADRAARLEEIGAENPTEAERRTR